MLSFTSHQVRISFCKVHREWFIVTSRHHIPVQSCKRFLYLDMTIGLNVLVLVRKDSFSKSAGANASKSPSHLSIPLPASKVAPLSTSYALASCPFTGYSVHNHLVSYYNRDTVAITNYLGYTANIQACFVIILQTQTTSYGLDRIVLLPLPCMFYYGVPTRRRIAFRVYIKAATHRTTSLRRRLGG